MLLCGVMLFELFKPFCGIKIFILIFVNDLHEHCFPAYWTIYVFKLAMHLTYISCAFINMSAHQR